MSHSSVPLQFQKTSLLAKTPVYNFDLDSGMDLFSIEDKVIYPGERLRIRTGIIFFIPIGYEIQIRSKSGLCWKQGLVVANSPGTIDCGYQKEVEVILCNISQDYIEIKTGFKIAQAVLAPVVQGELIEREGDFDKSTRREGGFGSTGLI